ncbi:hypothetical protein ACF0H5_002950 [Mactra antiquata]
MKVMSPGLIGSEVSATPPQQLRSTMDEPRFFPPISRKSDISICSESDPNDFCNPAERRIHTRGSVPASLSSSPLKFPTIDRANSTSVASLPGSRSTRHRSITKEFRTSYCRSPSCPSHLDFRNHETKLLKHTDSFRESPDGETSVSPYLEDSGTFLPNIFSKDNNSSRVEKSKASSRDRHPEKPIPLRRTESLMNACVSSMESPGTNRTVEARQGQAAALLLPLRNTNSQTNKKKKKRRPKPPADDDVGENTPRNNVTDSNDKSRARHNRKSEDALEAIARENDIYDDSDMETPRAIEINSSRKVKQWIKNNKHSHPENEVKA